MKATWLAVSLVLLIAGQAQADITSGALFDRHFEAVGGRAAIERIDSLILEGTGQEGRSTFQFELRIRGGLMLFIARTDCGIEIRQGRDRRGSCWRKDPDGLFELDAQRAGALTKLGLAFHLPSQVFVSARNLDPVCHEETEDGQTYAVIEPRNLEFPRFTFDKASGLLARIGQVSFGAYKQFDGIRLPSVIRPAPDVVFRIDRVTINPELDMAEFERPPGPLTARDAKRESAPAYATHLASPGTMRIVRRPEPAVFNRGELRELPRFSPASAGHWQVDVRSADLSQLDLTGRVTDLLHADFDSVTRWPDRLPDGFDPEQVLDLGRDPGLGVRQLHARGITGAGIGIGIVDLPLLVDHAEYVDRIRSYEEIQVPVGSRAEMHGPAVASIAVGKSVGVAPGADLYFIASSPGTIEPGGKFDYDFRPLARSIERLLDMNAMLPVNRRIRVISISVGWTPDQKGYREAMTAVERAARENVFVISAGVEHTHGLAFNGLGREPLADPNEFHSYGPGSWWAAVFWDNPTKFSPGRRLHVPMDSRAMASPTGVDDYFFCSSGGWSWAVPWLAGLYALACQVDPDITPDRFWHEAIQTGRNTTITKDSVAFSFGTLADPVALIEKLKIR